MAKLYFRYGAMGSSKTANVLMVRYNYIEKEQIPVLLKPRTDSRDGERVIRSRIGLEEPCFRPRGHVKNLSGPVVLPPFF